MVFISLTQEVAELLNIDLRKSETSPSYLPSLEDWLMDVIFSDANEAGIIFHNKLTGFAIALRPLEYNLNYCMDVFQQVLFRLLRENGLSCHIFYFLGLFARLQLFQSNDKNADHDIGKIKQSKAIHILVVSCSL